VGQNPVTSFGWLDWQIAGNCVDGTCQVTNQSESINCQTGTQLLAGSSMSHSVLLCFSIFIIPIPQLFKKKPHLCSFVERFIFLFNDMSNIHTSCNFVDSASKSGQPEFDSV